MMMLFDIIGLLTQKTTAAGSTTELSHVFDSNTKLKSKKMAGKYTLTSAQ